MEISVSILYRKIIGKPLTEKEEKLFEEWYSEREDHRLYWERFCHQQEKIQSRQTSSVDVEAGRLRFKKSQRKSQRRVVWIRYSVAASVILFVGLVGGILFRPQTFEKPIVASKYVPKQENVILKLSDGKSVALANNTLSTMEVNKKRGAILVESGVLHYQVDSVSQDRLEYNELKVPAAGEYQVILSDGTRVFLNSSSSLRYPVAFGGKERRVYLVGEAFFEVRPGPRPFIVETRIEEIKVFGTEFNVMHYDDEEQVQTTLVKGSIGVCLKNVSQEEYQKLIPGEQFVLDRQTGETMVRKVDVFPYVAWKDGLFVSQNDDLEMILRKVSRWFNVDIFYQNPELKKKRFFGIMKKQNSLENVLEIIEKAGNVKFRVNGNVVVVSE